jgi:hypothetical protein
MGILDDVMPVNIIINLKLPNQRVYRNACAIVLLRGHENLEEFVNDIFLDRLEMYPEGRAGLEDCIDCGFKTRDQMSIVGKLCRKGCSWGENYELVAST